MKRSLKGNEMRECYVSVDIETTGGVPGLYSMYEIGACVIGENKTFLRNLALSRSAKFSSDALRAVAMTKEKLLARNDAVNPAVAMSEFANWTRDVARGKRIVFVANNASFDWMFVCWYFEKFGVPNPFGHSALDMKAYYMGKTGCTWKEATLKNMAAHVGITFTSLPHRALEDAIIQGNIFRKLIKMKKETK